KHTSEVLTESERRAAMRDKAPEKQEKAAKGKTIHKKPSTKQKKRRASLSFSLKIINHILKKNMQITGNHQMARIVRHNDESLEVSEELGIAQSVISGLWQRFQDDDIVSRCYSKGRARVTTPNEDRYLAVTAKRNRRSAESDLSRQLLLRQFQGRACTDA
ncbi:uncharacterized protein TNCV_1970241, partial [Trichonephila clavipes]